MAESSSAIGNSGFVTAVGSENDSATRSRRAESGANGMSPSPAASSSACVGWGIGVVAVAWQSVERALGTAGWLCATVPTPWNDVIASATTMTSPNGRQLEGWAFRIVRSMMLLLISIDGSIVGVTLRLGR